MTVTPAAAKRLAKRKFADAVFRLACFIAALIGVLILVLFLRKIVIDGAGRLSWSFIRSNLSSRPNRTGIWPAIMGSVYVLGLTTLIAVPMGVSAAVYMDEFNTRKNRMSEFIQLNLANLAGVPSIVYGMLGLAVFVRWMALKQSVLSGSLTMSLLILPMVIIVTQEALRAVPKGYRDGSLALGSTYWQAIFHQVLPAAAPGIFTGIILAISRAVGETAPLIVVGAAAYVAGPPRGIGDSYTVLPIKIFDWAGEAKHGFNEASASAILILMIALLLLNSVAIILRAKARLRR